MTKTANTKVSKTVKSVSIEKRPAVAASIKPTSTTAYVEGIPFDWEESKIAETFADCGGISRVKAPTWHDSGRLKGYALIEFENASGLAQALKLDGVKVEGGRWLKVSVSTSEGSTARQPVAPSEATKSLFVGNLPYQVTEDEIASLFNTLLSKHSKSVAVEGVRVVTENGRTKGFGYVDFASIALSKKALESHAEKPLSIQGRQLRLDVHTGRKREGFHHRPEAYQATLVRPGNTKENPKP